MRLSTLTTEKVARAYFGFFAKLGRAVGAVVGVLVGAFAAFVGLCFLLLGVAYLKIWLGWWFLLIPAAIVAALLSALAWLRHLVAFDHEKNSK
jgi:hypothetical protein